MITLGRITQQADADGVDADTVERDYVLTHVMASLSHHPDNGIFQFKGGTLLRLCYFNDYRYSADIDLNLDPGVDVNDAVGVLGEILDATREHVGLPHRSCASSSLDRNERRGPGSSSSTSRQTS
jgi:predicted nucleotidyltransferase component of viral defense system